MFNKLLMQVDNGSHRPHHPGEHTDTDTSVDNDCRLLLNKTLQSVYFSLIDIATLHIDFHHSDFLIIYDYVIVNPLTI